MVRVKPAPLALLVLLMLLLLRHPGGSVDVSPSTPSCIHRSAIAHGIPHLVLLTHLVVLLLMHLGLMHLVVVLLMHMLLMHSKPPPLVLVPVPPP